MSEEKEKVCPYLPAKKDGKPATCVKANCAAWVTVYTIEHLPVTGCIRVLQPQMTDGLLRV